MGMKKEGIEKLVEMLVNAPSKVGHRSGTTGQYVGAPAGLDSPQKLGAARKNYQDLATEGADGADWYYDSSSFLGDITNNSEDAARLADVFGITSPGANVDVNMGFALKGLNQSIAGDSIRTGRFPGNMAPKIERALAGESDYLGHKVDPFAQNLKVNFQDVENPRAVHDIWEGRAWGYQGKNGKPWDAGFTPQQHSWMDEQGDIVIDRMNSQNAAGRSDWNTSRLQAGGWTGIKRRHGDIKPGDAAMHYGSYAPKYTAFGTHEQIPGAVTKHLEGITELPEDLRAAYSKEGDWRDIKGRDALYADLGAATQRSNQATGVFTPSGGGPTEFNPAQIARPLVGLEKRAGVTGVDESSTSILDAVESTRAYVDAQEAGAWHKLIANNKAGDRGSLTIPTSHPLDQAQMGQMNDLAGKNDFFMSDTGEAVNFLDYTDRSGIDLGKQLKTNLLDDIQSIIPGAKPSRVSADMGYQDYQAAWKAGDGSATKQMLSKLEENPEIFKRLDASPALREKAMRNLERDEAFAAEHNLPIRQDIQNARRIIAESSLSGLKAALQAGKVALPALAGIAVLIGQDQGASYDGLD